MWNLCKSFCETHGFSTEDLSLKKWKHCYRPTFINLPQYVGQVALGSPLIRSTCWLPCLSLLSECWVSFPFYEQLPELCVPFHPFARHGDFKIFIFCYNCLNMKKNKLQVLKYMSWSVLGHLYNSSHQPQIKCHLRYFPKWQWRPLIGESFTDIWQKMAFCALSYCIDGSMDCWIAESMIGRH